MSKNDIWKDLEEKVGKDKRDRTLWTAVKRHMHRIADESRSQFLMDLEMLGEHIEVDEEDQETLIYWVLTPHHMEWSTIRAKGIKNPKELRETDRKMWRLCQDFSAEAIIRQTVQSCTVEKTPGTEPDKEWDNEFLGDRNTVLTFVCGNKLGQVEARSILISHNGEVSEKIVNKVDEIDEPVGFSLPWGE